MRRAVPVSPGSPNVQGLPERPNYRARNYDLAGILALMPLARAFLDTCAATESADHRYLFALLGSESVGRGYPATSLLTRGGRRPAR